jgi:hypothetical protein
MKRTYSLAALLIAAGASLTAAGCHHGDCNGGGGGLFSKHKPYGGQANGPAHDRPFPVGQNSDSFWETQQTNAEAADFVFYDHEFKGNTAELAPGAKKHLEQVALRLEHVPFPIVIEESQHDARPALDEARRQTIVQQLGRMGVVNVEGRVVVANAFAEGITAVEAENAYWNVIGGQWGAGGGRRFGGSGGMYR